MGQIASFEYEIKFEDFRAANALVHQHCKSAGRAYRVLYVYGPILGAVCVFCVAFGYFLLRLHPSLWLLGIAVWGVFMALFGPWAYRKQLRQTWAKTLPQGRTTATLVFTLEEEHAMLSSPGVSEYKHAWASVQDIAEDKNILLLFISRANFLYIPKRVLTSELLDMIRAKVPVPKERMPC